MDKRTGKTVWKTDRSVDFQDLDPKTGEPRTEGDFRKAFSTPIVVEVRGKPILISLGSMALYGYEPETGKELWRVESIGSHSGAARPVAGNGVVFSPMGYTAEVWAVRPDGRGVVTRSHVVWKYPRATAKRSSPLLVGDWLFFVDSEGIAVCLEAKTGKEVWKARLGGNYSASPIYADGRIYFFDESGKSTVIEAGPEVPGDRRQPAGRRVHGLPCGLRRLALSPHENGPLSHRGRKVGRASSLPLTPPAVSTVRASAGPEASDWPRRRRRTARSAGPTGACGPV